MPSNHRSLVSVARFVSSRSTSLGSRNNTHILTSRFESLGSPTSHTVSPHAGLTPARSLRTSSQKFQQFRPATPPNPADLPKSRPVKHYPRTRKWLRRLVYFSLASGVILVLDNQFNASSIHRSLRTFQLGLLVAIDYKVNFRPHPFFYKDVDELHLRNAQRLFDLLHTNGGLYLKIGQAIAMQSAVLPPAFQKMFERMFDDAPQNTWAEVERVVREDFGKSPEELFGTIEHKARASASVAQVHWAKLPDGREVAVKIQKREIAKQVGWDLWAFKVVSRTLTWWFDLPFYNLVPFITERLMLETDFENEASNSERMKEFVANEKRLAGRVYIPKVFWDLTSRRVMTAEWIEGVRLWDKEGVTKPWYGGWRHGTPGCKNEPLDRKDTPTHTYTQKDIDAGHIKPDRSWWKGRTGTGGLGLRMSDVMQTMVDLFSAQMFLFGWVHCDPHPGNIFVRRTPSGKAELVLIDHGLYIKMSPTLRRDYARLWKSLMTFDNQTISDVVTSWGIDQPEIFASMTMMKPYEGGEGRLAQSIQEVANNESLSERERAFEIHKRMREMMKKMLKDFNKFPQELIFIGRNLRIVQGNNQFLGSPVNRIKITSEWASRATYENADLPFNQRLVSFGRHLLFKLVLVGSDLFFYFSKIRQFFGIGGGMEDDMEKSVAKMAKGMGIELNHGVFEG